MTANVPTALEVQITSERSRPLAGQVYVEVSSLVGGVRRGYTDSNGRVNFAVPSGGNYQITASGPDIVTASTSCDISQGERMHFQELQVKMRAAGTSPRPGGVISGETLRIPEKARHEFAKGMAEMHAQNWSKARQHFLKAVKVYPQLDLGYNSIGLTYIQEKNVTAAREAFEKALAINSKNRDAVKNLARLRMSANDWSGAKQLLLKIGPDARDPEAMTMLAYAQLNNGELDSALANALKVHQGDADHFPQAHLIAARVYEVEGKRSESEAQYQAYLNEASNTPEAHLAKEGLQRLAGK